MENFSRFGMTLIFSPVVRAAAALATVAIAAGLFVVGAKPIAVGLLVAPWDKLVHVAVFAGIGFAAGVASGWRGLYIVVSCVGGALFVGIVDEWHQMGLPGRAASLWDLAADVIGGLLGAALLAFIHRYVAQTAKHR